MLISIVELLVRLGRHMNAGCIAYQCSAVSYSDSRVCSGYTIVEGMSEH